MSTQHFIVEGQWLGQAPRGLKRIHETFEPPRGYAFLCPTCGDVWAKAPVEQQTFLALHSPCSKHPGWYGTLPGSLWSEYDEEFNASFPPAVLRREFDLHLNAMEIAT